MSCKITRPSSGATHFIRVSLAPRWYSSSLTKVYYDCLGWYPFYPSFYRSRGGRVYMEDLVGYDSTWPGLYFYLPYLQYLILYLSSKLPRFSAPWPVCSGRVGLFREPPPPQVLSIESRRNSTPSTSLRKKYWVSRTQSIVFMEMIMELIMNIYVHRHNNLLFSQTSS
jgi:hypothetical protein